MANFKLTISDKKGRSLTKELKENDANPFVGLNIGNEIDAALVTVDNGDVAAHTYQLCAVLSDGTAITSGLGCVTTGSIGAGANSIENIDFATDIDTIISTQIYITLEELS